MAEDTTKYKHLSDLDLADSSNDEGDMEIELLIGSDYYWDFTTGDICRGDDGPVAICITSEWVLSGAMRTLTHQQSSLITRTLRTNVLMSTESLDNVLHSFWESRHLGSRGMKCLCLKSSHRQHGRYEFTFPWKDPHPSYYELSDKRLKDLLCHLKEHPVVMLEYDTTIRNRLKEGIVEEVEEPDDPESGKVHYLLLYKLTRRLQRTASHMMLQLNPAEDVEFLVISIAKEDRDASRFL